MQSSAKADKKLPSRVVVVIEMMKLIADFADVPMKVNNVFRFTDLLFSNRYRFKYFCNIFALNYTMTYGIFWTIFLLE